MALSTRCALVLCILLCLASPLWPVVPDDAVLDQVINVDLRDASMSSAVAVIANAADIWIVGPGEPSNGIVMRLNGQTVRQILDGLAVATGTTWSIRDDIVVFTKPVAPPAEQRKPPKRTEPISPEQGMSEMVASLNSTQFYALSSGYPIGYADMSTQQQSILKDLLSDPTVAVNEAGEIVSEMPAPERVTISFATLPYLTVPTPEGTGTATIRLDTTPYMYLKRNIK